MSSINSISGASAASAATPSPAASQPDLAGASQHVRQLLVVQELQTKLSNAIDQFTAGGADNISAADLVSMDLLTSQLSVSSLIAASGTKQALDLDYGIVGRIGG